MELTAFVGPLLSMLLVAIVIHSAKQLEDMASALKRIEDHLRQLEARQAFTEALAARAQQPVGIAPANGTQPYPRVGIVEG